MPYILPNDGSSTLLDYDLTISETHTHMADVTDHPVEVGSDVSDNVRINPTELSLVIFMTNTPHRAQTVYGAGDTFSYGGDLESVDLVVPTYEPPLEPTPGSLFRLAEGAIGAALDAITGGPGPLKASLLSFPSAFDRLKDMHNALIDIESAGTLCTVVTLTKNYDDMLITGITLPRETFGGAEITVAFKQIRVVSSKTVIAPTPKEPKGLPAVSKGAQSADAMKDGAPAQSIASKLKDQIKDLLSSAVPTPL